MRRNFFSGLFLVLMTIWPVATAQSEVLTIGGTGSSGPLIQLLFDEFQSQAPDITLRILSPPLGSTGAIKAVALGRVDLAMVGRPLSVEELNQYGKNFNLADTPFIMASRDGQRPNGFTLEELSQVFDGTLQRWESGALIRLVLRSSLDSDTLLLKSIAPQLADALDLAIKRPGMVFASNDLDTVSLLAKTSGSLGPTTLGLLTTLSTHLTVFPVNGVVPNLVNLKNGTYPWYKRLTVVLPIQASPAAKSFADFLQSPKAYDVMVRNDYLPVFQK